MNSSDLGKEKYGSIQNTLVNYKGYQIHIDRTIIKKKLPTGETPTLAHSIKIVDQNKIERAKWISTDDEIGAVAAAKSSIDLLLEKKR